LPKPSLTPEQRKIAERIADRLVACERSKDRQRAVADAAEFLEALMGLGFRLLSPANEGGAVPAEGGKLLTEVAAAGSDFRRLRDLWATHDPERWAPEPAAYTMLGDALLKCGEPILAFDVLHKGLEVKPDYRMKQLCALALLRSGAVDSARTILLQLISLNPADEESLGMLARAEKNLAISESDPERSRRHWLRAFLLYRNAFRRTGGYWTGINAATIALVLGRGRIATRIANEVVRICREQSNGVTSGENLFWAYATLGEASLIMGEESAAEDYYRKAMAMPAAGPGNVASMRRNVKLILKAAARKFSLDQSLPVPPVVVFAGHLLDGPGRKTKRFPAEAVPRVRDDIRKYLGGKPCSCYSSAACGSDILFLEENGRNGGENYIVLPFPEADFLRSSVTAAEGDWEERFHMLIQRAANVYVLSKGRSAFSSIEFEFTNSVILGLGLLKARQMDSALKALAVWDGAEGELGGTSHAVELWRKLGIPIQVIPPLHAERPRHGSKAKVPERKGEFTPEIRAILFADALGFSRLVESQIPTFFQDFMGVVGGFVRQGDRPPLCVNAWGDGLYMVFACAQSAGCFALQLHRRLMSIDWSSRGLPADLALRIGLHAGPVYACNDPVTGLPTFVGAQVTRAARIEPITPPGSVYVSEQFAALAAAEGVREFDCEYVGMTPAAKGYGDYPTYVLQSRV
jgi:class 3 adenylate cyclase/tetratricopeptide (TPR) repeat protein